MAKRPLKPQEAAAAQAHIDRREAERAADDERFDVGELVDFLNADVPQRRFPGVVEKATPSIFGMVFWVDLGGGKKVRTTGQRLRRRKGFTLIELLIVLAILALLISLLAPSIRAARESGRLTRCTSNLTQIRAAMMMYVDAYREAPVWNEYPDDADRWNIEPTQAVWVCPSDAEKGVNRRGGLTSYDASGFRNMMYHALRPRRSAAVTQANTAPHLQAVAWDYSPVHFGKRNRVFVVGKPRLVP